MGFSRSGIGKLSILAGTVRATPRSGTGFTVFGSNIEKAALAF